MYPRDSRYRFVEEASRTDAGGRELLVTGLRPRPDRTGEPRHRLQDGDRLDHLGQLFYRQPHRWWEICDGNPGVLSPLALIGAEPLRTARIRVPPIAPSPPWHAVLAELRSRPGVERLDLAEEAGTVLITVIYNELSITPGDLADIVQAHGVNPVVTRSPAPAGSQLVVPPPSGRP